MTLRFLLMTFVLAVSWPAHAGAPPGRYGVSAGTVSDRITGLTWQQIATSPKVTWQQATTYCPSLMLDGGGWRMPPLKELLSLIDPNEHDPAIDHAAFPGAAGSPFWTSSPVEDDDSTAWSVDFASGASAKLSRTMVLYVRCVR